MKKRETSKLETETIETLSLDGKTKIAVVNLTKGAVNLTRVDFPIEMAGMYEAAVTIGDESQNKLVLEWQKYSELGEDHGFGVCYSVLNSENNSEFHGYSIDQMISKIKEDKGVKIWERIESYVSKFGENTSSYKTFLKAAFVELFEEPFEERWLAANALHAAYVREDYYAFGYLTALLDQKLNNNEAHLLRGKKNVESAKLGGQARSRKLNPRTTKILREMKRLIQSGQTIARAAALASNNGLGSSQAANKRLWTRHVKK